MTVAAIRSRTTLVLLVAVTAAAAALVHMARQRSDPASILQRAWTRSGVAKPNVILITLDTTRADHLGSYGDADARTPATGPAVHGAWQWGRARAERHVE